MGAQAFVYFLVLFLCLSLILLSFCLLPFNSASLSPLAVLQAQICLNDLNISGISPWMSLLPIFLNKQLSIYKLFELH